MCWKRTFADCLLTKQKPYCLVSISCLTSFKWRANTVLRVLWQSESILLKRCNLADENIYRIWLKQLLLDYKIVSHLWWHASHNAFSNFALWPHFRHNILCGSIHCRNGRLVITINMTINCSCCPRYIKSAWNYFSFFDPQWWCTYLLNSVSFVGCVQ